MADSGLRYIAKTLLGLCSSFRVRRPSKLEYPYKSNSPTAVPRTVHPTFQLVESTWMAWNPEEEVPPTKIVIELM